jgi:rare lipoprotein A
MGEIPRSYEFFSEKPLTIRIRQERQRAVHRSIGICQLQHTAACCSAREFALATNRSVVVVITDRGPRFRDRVLDLSLGAARSLGITDRGVAQVRVEVL